MVLILCVLCSVPKRARTDSTDGRVRSTQTLVIHQWAGPSVIAAYGLRDINKSQGLIGHEGLAQGGLSNKATSVYLLCTLILLLRAYVSLHS